MQPALTRRRELFVGRLAMVGFASALIGEVATGKGVIGQIAQELSIPSGLAELGLYGTIAYGLIGALVPGSPTFSKSNQQDVKKRGKGPTQNPKIRPTDAANFAGTSKGFGFTKQNEIVVGRTAQLGFAAAVIGEKVTGKGPLTQFGLETGIPLGTASIGLVIFISFFLVAALFEGNYGDEAINEDSSY